MSDFKLKYAASATITISLASLGSSATWVAGRESDVVLNTSFLYIDAYVSGVIRVGTSPTAGTQIRVMVYAAMNDTPTYPDVFDGTDSAETITSAGVGNGMLAQGALLDVDATTSDRDYFVKPFSVAKLFDWVMPTHWGLFVTHNTGQNLNSTGGNHVLKYTGVHLQSV